MESSPELYAALDDYKTRLALAPAPTSQLEDELLALLARIRSDPCAARTGLTVCASMCLASIFERIDAPGYASAVLVLAESLLGQVAALGHCWSCIHSHRVRALLGLGRVAEADEHSAVAVARMRAACARAPAAERQRMAPQLGLAIHDRGSVAVARRDGAGLNAAVALRRSLGIIPTSPEALARADQLAVAGLLLAGQRQRAGERALACLARAPATYASPAAALAVAREHTSRGEGRAALQLARAAESTASRLEAHRDAVEAHLIAAEADDANRAHHGQRIAWHFPFLSSRDLDARVAAVTRIALLRCTGRPPGRFELP
jgi:hypothetical protein